MILSVLAQSDAFIARALHSLNRLSLLLCNVAAVILHLHRLWPAVCRAIPTAGKNVIVNRLRISWLCAAVKIPHSKASAVTPRRVCRSAKKGTYLQIGQCGMRPFLTFLEFGGGGQLMYQVALPARRILPFAVATRCRPNPESSQCGRARASPSQFWIPDRLQDLNEV